MRKRRERIRHHVDALAHREKLSHLRSIHDENFHKRSKYMERAFFLLAEVTLSMVDGATAEQGTWHIESAELLALAPANRPTH